jgi:hypothetical protein
MRSHAPFALALIFGAASAPAAPPAAGAVESRFFAPIESDTDTVSSRLQTQTFLKPKGADTHLVSAGYVLDGGRALTRRNMNSELNIYVRWDKEDSFTREFQNIFNNCIQELSDDSYFQNVLLDADAWTLQQRRMYEYDVIKEINDQLAKIPALSKYRSADTAANPSSKRYKDLNALSFDIDHDGRTVELDCEQMSLLKALLMQKIDRHFLPPVSGNNFKFAANYYYAIGRCVDLNDNANLDFRGHAFFFSGASGNYFEATESYGEIPVFIEKNPLGVFLDGKPIQLAGYPEVIMPVNLSQAKIPASLFSEGASRKRLYDLNEAEKSYKTLLQRLPERQNNFTDLLSEGLKMPEIQSYMQWLEHDKNIEIAAEIQNDPSVADFMLTYKRNAYDIFGPVQSLLYYAKTITKNGGVAPDLTQVFRDIEAFQKTLPPWTHTLPIQDDGDTLHDVLNQLRAEVPLVCVPENRAAQPATILNSPRP